MGLAAARQDGGNWSLEKGDSSRRDCEQGQEAKTIDAPIIWGIGPTGQRDCWGGRRTQMNGERRTGDLGDGKTTNRVLPRCRFIRRVKKVKVFLSRN